VAREALGRPWGGEGRGRIVSPRAQHVISEINVEKITKETLKSCLYVKKKQLQQTFLSRISISMDAERDIVIANPSVCPSVCPSHSGIV